MTRMKNEESLGCYQQQNTFGHISVKEGGRGSSSTCFACYRLPYAETYTRIESYSEAERLNQLAEIGQAEGFVIAPFNEDTNSPLLLIHPDCITHHTLTDGPTVRLTDGRCYGNAEAELMPTADYELMYGRFSDAIKRGEFQKLVLSRQKDTVLAEDVDAVVLFERACRLFPRLMIMLFSTSATGTWLIASPEVLVESCRGTWHTMALAGTMPFAGGVLEWSEKNRREQRVVEEYIANTLKGLCRDIVTDGPYTMRAGNLVHLRTDFRFHIESTISAQSHRFTTLGQIISALHPTPAVCGMPKSEARDFICKNEVADRRYYSGFAGPVGIDNETHLYVSLRCASIEGRKMIFYAGGGIMPDSCCHDEWKESEEKIKTIAHVLQYP